MNLGLVLTLLRTWYPPPEWIFVQEVRNGTGHVRNLRSADGIALNTYPSRGLTIHGFELKQDRGDWVKELKNPDKAEDGAWKYCNEWWLVVTDKQIVRDGELPRGWGLIAPDEKDKKLKRWVVPTHRKAKPMTTRFVAALMRVAISQHRSDEEVTATIEEELEKRVEMRTLQYKRSEERWESTAKEMSRREQELRDKIRKFEETSGVNISYQDGSKIGSVVHRVLHDDRLQLQLENYAQILRGLSTATDEARAGTGPLEGAQCRYRRTRR